MTSTFDKYLAQIANVTKATGIFAYRGQQNSRWSAPLSSYPPFDCGAR